MPDRKEIIRQVEEKMAFGDSNNWTFTKKVEPMVTDRNYKEPVNLNSGSGSRNEGLMFTLTVHEKGEFMYVCSNRTAVSVEAAKELAEEAAYNFIESSNGEWKDPEFVLSFAGSGVPVHRFLLSDLTYMPDSDHKDSPLNTQQGGTHYKDFPIQPVEYIHKNGIGYMEGNVIKYVSRHKSKNGKEDLLKAIHYLEMLIELEYGQE
jgi:hypothetical protein